MGHKKLIRFNALNSFSNVLQNPENIAGEWQIFFKNNHAIVLELACGKGEYSVNLGRGNKDKNYIGIDIKGNRIYSGAKTALEEKLDNVAFLRVRIEHIDQYFAPREVDEVWILFPDPFLRDSRAKNRLTHARFLYLYKKILKEGGFINLKTDSKELYDFTLETINEQGCVIHENIADIYGKGKATGALAIQTYYEKMHLAEGRTIYYIRFSLPEAEIKIPERFIKNEQHAD
jgi:tRNA (guanine-N7-)-methyltransferase